MGEATRKKENIYIYLWFGDPSFLQHPTLIFCTVGWPINVRFVEICWTYLTIELSVWLWNFICPLNKYISCSKYWLWATFPFLTQRRRRHCGQTVKNVPKLPESLPNWGWKSGIFRARYFGVCAPGRVLV